MHAEELPCWLFPQARCCRGPCPGPEGRPGRGRGCAGDQHAGWGEYNRWPAGDSEDLARSPAKRPTPTGAPDLARAFLDALPIAAAVALVTQAANALTYDELQSLTYLQVKGSGLANTCPVLSTGSTNLKDLKSGTYKLERFCMEPTSFSVKEESQFKGGETSFASTKLMTRLTYTLDGVRLARGARARARMPTTRPQCRAPTPALRSAARSQHSA